VSLPASEIDRILAEEADHECAGFGEQKICVRIAAIVDLPSRYGHFQVVGFWNNRDGRDHVAILHGNPIGKAHVPTRLHSECLTGDALGSMRCDCRDQLEVALREIAAQEYGIVLYLRQEGRGIGLLNKLRAYGLQDRGMDTVEANLALGFRDDEREYSIAAHMLHSLKVQSVQLMTNNPKRWPNSSTTASSLPDGCRTSFRRTSSIVSTWRRNATAQDTCSIRRATSVCWNRARRCRWRPTDKDLHGTASSSEQP